MKRGDIHLNDHHVLRCIKNRSIIRDADGKVLGLYPDAFELREGEEYLSINWCEFFGSPVNQTVVSSCIDSVKETLTIKPKSIFAFANIGNIHTAHFAISGKSNLRIKYWPDNRNLSHNPSHSAIFNLDQNEETLNNLTKNAFNVYYDSTCNPIAL